MRPHDRTVQETGIDWHERRLISKLYKDQSVEKYDWTEETQEVGRLEEELDRDAVCHRFYSACTGSTLPTRLLKCLETSK